MQHLFRQENPPFFKSAPCYTFINRKLSHLLLKKHHYLDSQVPFMQTGMLTIEI